MQNTKTMKPVFGIALFAVFSTVVLLLATFANTGAQIRLAASSLNVQPGETINVDVLVDSGDGGVTAIDTVVEYDTTSLSFTGFTASGAGGFSVSPPAVIDNGTISVKAFQSDIFNATGVEGSDLLLGQIAFVVQQAAEQSTDIALSTNTVMTTVDENGDAKDFVPVLVPATLNIDLGSDDTTDSTTGATDATTTGATGNADGTEGSATTGADATTGTTGDTSGSTDTGGSATGDPDARPTVGVSSSVTEISDGDEVSVDVVVNTSTNEVTAAHAIIAYDTSALTLTAVTGSTNGGFTVQTSDTDDDGLVNLRAFKADILSEGGLSGQGLELATLTFNVVAGTSGSTTVSVDSGSAITELQGGDAVDVTPLSESHTFNVTAGTGAATTGADADSTTTGTTTGTSTGNTGGEDATTGETTGGSSSAETTTGTASATTTTGGETTTGGSTGGTPSEVAKINLSATNVSPEVGKETAVSLKLDTGDYGVSAVDITVSYDPSKLTFQKYTKPSAGFSVQTPATPSDGTVEIRAFQSDIFAANGLSGNSLPLGLITFSARAVGGSAVTLAGSSLVTEVRDSNGVDVKPDFNSVTITSVEADVSDETKPTAPSDLTAQATSATAVKLNWGASRDASGIDKYVLYRREQGSSNYVVLASSIPGNQTAYTDSKVFSDRTYEYKVRAIDNNGNESSFSNVAKVKTPKIESGTSTTGSSTTTTTTTGSSSTGGSSSTTGSPNGPPDERPPVDPGSGGRPNPNGDDITEDDVQAVEDPAEAFGSNQSEPSEELVGKIKTKATNYKKSAIKVDFKDIRRAFIQYGLFEEGLFNRTDEVEWDGQGELELELDGLTPGTRYFYQVVAEDKDGNELYGEVQEINTLGYTVSTTITDSKGNPLPLLAVTLFSDPIQAQTDESGVAVFENVSPGEHTLDFNYEGEQISQSITVEDTIVEDDGTAPEQQVFTVTATSTVAGDGGGSGLATFIGILVVLVVIAAVVYFFIRKQQQPYSSSASYDSQVITPGPSSSQDLHSVAGQQNQSPGSVYDPNQK